MRDRHIKEWLRSGSTWTPIYEDGKPHRSKLWIFVTIMITVACITGLVYLAGYAVGYNDNLAAEIAKYRVMKKTR
jgi:hypothetical protein